MYYVIANFDEQPNWHVKSVSDKFITERNWVKTENTIISDNGKVFQIIFSGNATKTKAIRDKFIKISFQTMCDIA